VPGEVLDGCLPYDFEITFKKEAKLGDELTATVPAQCEARCEAGAGGGLAHATLAGGHDDYFGHVCTVP
jgi:hypothetical protein